MGRINFYFMFCFFNVVGGHNISRLPTTTLATIKYLDADGNNNILIRIYTKNLFNILLKKEYVNLMHQYANLIF